MAEVLVVDKDGNPLKDARVSVALTDAGESGRGRGRGRRGNSQRTDEQGRVLVLVQSGQDIALSVSSGRDRFTQTVNGGSFPLTVNMKDATRIEMNRPGRSAFGTGDPRERGRRRGQGGNR